jgi:hypothetical protein
VLLDVRLWLLIALSVAMLFTIEAIEDFVEGSWPQLRRPMDVWGAFGELRNLWITVAMFVLPGLVLTILNLALLLVRDLPHSNVQVLGTIFIIVGWLVFLLCAINLAGMGSYFLSAGSVIPLSLMLILGIGNLLLVITLIDIFPDDIRALIPFGQET